LSCLFQKAGGSAACVLAFCGLYVALTFHL
jgi:hypothetical protein